MSDSVAGGRYTVVWRAGAWIVRAPDAKDAKSFGRTDDDKRQAEVWAARANEKLRAIDQR